jgi:hypothetical protein
LTTARARHCVDAASEAAWYSAACHPAATPPELQELYASASAVGRIATERRGTPTTCKEVFDLAAQGDAQSQALVQETARFLALGCVGITRMVCPARIVFCGGMAASADILVPAVIKAFHNIVGFASPESVWSDFPCPEISASTSSEHDGQFSIAMHTNANTSSRLGRGCVCREGTSSGLAATGWPSFCLQHDITSSAEYSKCSHAGCPSVVVVASR